jgi:hypothetical protein
MSRRLASGQQLELGLPKCGTSSLEDWMKSYNPQKDLLRHHDKDEEPYNPRKLRKFLLIYLSYTEWTGFIGLADECRQSTYAVSRVLDILESCGRVEKTPLYFYPWSELLQPDRTIHPGFEKNQYQGFEFGYRLKNKTTVAPKP